MARSTSASGLKHVNFLQRHWKLIAVLSIATALVVYVTLCLLTIGRSSAWFDESFSAYIIRFDFLKIAQYTSLDVHPPLFYWLLKVWANIFTHTDVALRAMSVFFGGGIIVSGFFLAKKMFGRGAALLSLVLLALSPLLIRYGIEARMYTVAAFFVIVSTVVMLRAEEKKSRGLWILYGVLVAAGLWTHYFTALAFVAQWLWRFIIKRCDGARGRALLKEFFNRNFLWAGGTALALFLPWLPMVLWQFRTVQGAGFWIPPVGADTLTSYATDMLMYKEHGEVGGWLAALLFVGLGLAILLTVRVFRTMKKQRRDSFLLLVIMSVSPVVLLFAMSLPPLRSSFVDRYLLPSVATTMILFAVVATIKSTSKIRILQVGFVSLLIAMFAIGFKEIWQFGNFNKTTGTSSVAKQITAEIRKASDPSVSSERIIASTPWLYYDLMVYDSFPVYFLDASTDYYYGSLTMLKENDFRKIKDLTHSLGNNEKFWYVDVSGDAITKPPADDLRVVQEITVPFPHSDKSAHAIEYKVK